MPSNEFEVAVDASFVPSHEFSEQLFEFVNWAASGRFRGTAQGGAELKMRSSETDWNNVESVLAFTKGIIDVIHAENVSKQVKDVKRLYPFGYFDARYEFRLSGNNLDQLFPGDKGLLLLVF